MKYYIILLIYGYEMIIYIYIMIYDTLVGDLEHFLFFHILEIIIPSDFHICQRGWSHQPAMIYYDTLW